MITSITVSKFQSLNSIALQPEKLTVIVGPSSSGKSALIRALRLLAFNSSGSSFVTHGFKSAAVSCEIDDQAVLIQKGKGVSSYHLNGEVFDKCGTSTPEAVANVLRITPGNFAGQFDRPFLLDDTGGAVARELGELTNVSVILEAAREGNRRKTEVTGRIKTRETDLADLVEGVKAFAGLPKRTAAVVAAEQAVKEADQVADKVGRLGQAVTTVRVAQGVIDRLSGDLPEIPDLTDIESLQSQIVGLDQLVRDHYEAKLMVDGWQEAVGAREIMEQEAHAAFHAALVDAGTCPLCGQETK